MRIYTTAEDAAAITAKIEAGQPASVRVPGRRIPWPCYLDFAGRLRAWCPSAPRVKPLVVPR